MHEAIKSKENQISFKQFTQAAEIFSDDYVIVGHGGESLVGYFDKPRRHGEYTVSGLNGMPETDFLRKLNEKPLFIYIACMDKRGARKSYDAIKKEIRLWHKVVGFNLLSLFQGGGIVQVDVAIRNGRSVTLNRSQALKTILQYIALHAKDIKLVFATGHDCSCGACAFYNNNIGVPEQLGVDKGDPQEQQAMKRSIKQSINEIIPSDLRCKTKGYLAHFDPTTDEFESFR